MNQNLYYKNKSLETLNGELWRAVVGYNNHYYVSNYGRVKVVEKGKTKCILSQKEKSYLMVVLSKDGIKKLRLVHKLVATAFIPPIEGKLYVNHKDGHKYNNLISNLEWCTLKENAQHSVHVLGNKPPLGTKFLFNQFGENNQRAKAVLQIKDGKIVAEYSCINEATLKTGIIHSGISRCCNGKQRTSKGFEWKYK